MKRNDNQPSPPLSPAEHPRFRAKISCGPDRGNTFVTGDLAPYDLSEIEDGLPATAESVSLRIDNIEDLGVGRLVGRLLTRLEAKGVHVQIERAHGVSAPLSGLIPNSAVPA